MSRLNRRMPPLKSDLAHGPKADKPQSFKPLLSVRNLLPLKAEDIVDEFIGI